MDSCRRPSRKAPKQAWGKEEFSAVLIFHTALTNDASPRQPSDFGWTRKTADEWPEPEVERAGSPGSTTMPSPLLAPEEQLIDLSIRRYHAYDERSFPSD